MLTCAKKSFYASLFVIFVIICVTWIRLLAQYGNNIRRYRSKVSNGAAKWFSHDTLQRRNLSHTPAEYYCNFPDNSEDLIMQEGKGNAGWSLRQVQIVIRHGDRTPLKLNLYEHLGIKPSFCNFFEDNLAYDHEKLVQYRKVVASQLLKSLSNKLLSKQESYLYSRTMMDSSVCSPAQLTTRGVLQHLHNGFRLQEIYLGKHDLFNGSSHLKQVEVVSTHYTRTFLSAMAFMYGLIPDYELFKLPTRLVESTLFCGGDCRCSLASLLQKVVNKRQYQIYVKRQRLNATILKVASTLPVSDRTGAQLDSLVTGFLCKELNLPCNSSGGCITERDLDNIMEEHTHMNKIIIEETPSRSISMLSIQPMLEGIVKKMANIKDKVKDTPKLVLYSGHDTTVRALLEALQIPDYRWPRLASRFIFELWEHRTKYFIKILFNGKDVTANAAFCSGIPHGVGCPYKNFEIFTMRGIAKHFGAKTRRNACLRI